MTDSLEPVDVVVIGPDHLDSFACNIAAGFEDLGISVRVLDPFARLAGRRGIGSYGKTGTAIRRVAEISEVVRARMIDGPIARVLTALEPRLVVNVCGYFRPEQVQQWRECSPNATWAMWYPDAWCNLGNHAMLLAPYDHLFFKDPYIVDLFSRRANVPSHYLAEACNPRHHRPDSEARVGKSRNAIVVMIGNMYPYRLLAMERLDANIDLRIYGNLRKALPKRFRRLNDAHVGAVVFGADKARTFGEARIVLNTMHYGEVGGVNSRLFEATACGGFVLTHANDALHRYFDVGRELVAFETPTEMNSAIRHYLNEPEERARIAAAGAARTHRDHTYALRVAELIEVCGLTEALRVASSQSST